ncbi:MAG TPA: hypothetical protein GXZ59_08615, partial [Clostridiaceae bacterium]|nr:hypothetical protein [Clostridiaceae bacterium]
MKKTTKLLAMLLALVMVVGLVAACGNGEAEETDPPATDATDAPDETETEPEETDPEETDPEPAADTPLVVGYNQFSQKFSPYYADTSYDQDVADFTQVSLLTNDRAGELMLQAGTPAGQVSEYNGVPYTYYAAANLEIETVDAEDDGTIEETIYRFKLRDDITFSDGEPLTIDDVIFSFYAFSDPKYTGSSTLYSVPIVGMNEYRTQTSA